MTGRRIAGWQHPLAGRRVLRALLAMLLMLAPAAARAACTISAATLSFGTYTGAALNTGTGSVTVNCSLATVWNIGINTGSHAAGGNYTWQMTDANLDALSYSMYRDSSRTLLWGGTALIDTIGGVGTGSAQTVNFYASMPSNGAANPGFYTDTITVTLYSLSGNPSNSINVSATVPANCTLSAGALAFGVYSGAQADAAATISVTCSNTTPYSVGLQQGLHPTCCGLQMAGPGGALLPYNIYRNPSRTLAWGNTIGSDEVTGIGNGSNQSLTVYGRIPAGQMVTPGSYSDMVIATINY